MRAILVLLFLLMPTVSTYADVLIGVAGPMTGTYSTFGAQMVQGVQAAVDQLNAKGGIEGELIEIAVADDQCDNRKAELSAQELVAKNVNVVIGHFCSNPALAAAKIYEAAAIPMISPSASLPGLTEAGLTNVIRLASRDDAQGKYAASRMKIDYAPETLALISDGSAADEALVGQFTAGLGVAPAAKLDVKTGTKLSDTMIEELTSKQIAAVYCACAASDAGVFATQFVEANRAIKIFGPDALLVPAFWEKSSDAGEGTFASFALDPQASPAAKKIAKQLAAEGQVVEGAVLPSFAATQVFAAAAEKVGAKNGRAIADYLHSGITIETAIGSLAFDAKGDLREPRFVWYVWSKGKFTTEYSDK